MMDRIGRLLLLVVIFVTGCGEDATKRDQPEKSKSKPVAQKKILVETPSFSSDSAFVYIQKQVDFGPRVPNTEAQKKCANYLVNKLASIGLDTLIQRGSVRAYNGKPLRIYNIMGRYRPELPNRIVFFAHWDSRPYADRGQVKRTKPIDGANDGASGVGVLLEMARTIAASKVKPNCGYDIVFFDAEDYGRPQETMTQDVGDTWCLGAQYWSNNIPFKNYMPRYGILLDMVGAENAVFPKEGWSLYYNPGPTHSIWAMAHGLGHGKYFDNRQMNYGLTDDHKYVNEIAGIPTTDIVHYELNRSDFGSFHHTHEDNIGLIHKPTLQAVGETILQALYQEQ